MYKIGIANKISKLLYNDKNNVTVYKTNKSLELIITLEDKTKCYYSGYKNMLCVTKNNLKLYIGDFINKTPKYILDKFNEIQKEK